jgi:hypothetical protein
LYMLYLLCMPYMLCMLCMLCMCGVFAACAVHAVYGTLCGVFFVYYLQLQSAIRKPTTPAQCPNTRPQTLCGVCCGCAMYAGFASCMCCVSCLCCILGHGWPGADSIGRGGILGSHRMGWGGLGLQRWPNSVPESTRTLRPRPASCGAAANYRSTQSTRVFEACLAGLFGGCFPATLAPGYP